MKTPTNASTIAAACFVLAGLFTASAHADEKLVVVELFQSQGCSSCPPANANVIAAAERGDVLALSYHVTYWDHLGWKDTFAKPAFTERQRAYARTLGSGVYTPQVVVNGRADLVGSDRGALDTAIRRNLRPPFELKIVATPGAVTVGAAASRSPSDVWLVRYDPRITQVPIRRGENGGRTLPHRNVVQEIVRLGSWSGAERRYDLPASKDPALRAAILVQRSDIGAIVAAERVPPPG